MSVQGKTELEISCIRMRLEYPNHVWSWDFVMERTRDARVLRILVLIDEFSRRCLALNGVRQIPDLGDRSKTVLGDLSQCRSHSLLS